MRKYTRDKRSPKPKSAAVSRVMSANKRGNTNPEIIFRAALREKGLIGYRLHWKKVPGSPDVAFPNKKLAVFINGCFWHRCADCKFPLPKTNKIFWQTKFKRNKNRDVKKVELLKKIGWKSVTVWEHEIKNNPGGAAKKVSKLYFAAAK